MVLSACNLCIMPLRAEASHRSEMVTQVLFGEPFEILEEGIDFDHIRLLDTSYEGWIQRHQSGQIATQESSRRIIGLTGGKASSTAHTTQLLHGTPVPNDSIQIGNELYTIEGVIREGKLDDFDIEFPKLIQHYNNSPYLWGGRSPYGIDCSGFSQVVYRHFGIGLKRDAWQQAESGDTVDFLPEIKAGDLAFFDNEAGRITHVGIMIDNETIIHAAGRVRIDKMDTEGIFNAQQNKYTHKLRIVKRYF
ncbi:C40 family peptidase [Sphingobacterium yanglingense]|uniref:NlpC/P60 family protein n=1 Tax=Sphingobacterium yanglingense TaxID=1437280 RepID=A0A4R6WNE3_9SPHI|nr:C40 family peptidase [Sphingobacterium yanglingense]TDQ79631.1 NlpC/P60 family protein [Sphingobacterium yanglingense]